MEAEIGKIDQFNESSETRTGSKERLEQCFVANDIKVIYLLALVGPKIYLMLRDLTSSDLPATNI